MMWSHRGCCGGCRVNASQRHRQPTVPVVFVVGCFCFVFTRFPELTQPEKDLTLTVARRLICEELRNFFDLIAEVVRERLKILDMRRMDFHTVRSCVHKRACTHARTVARSLGAGNRRRLSFVSVRTCAQDSNPPQPRQPKRRQSRSNKHDRQPPQYHTCLLVCTCCVVCACSAM